MERRWTSARWAVLVASALALAACGSAPVHSRQSDAISRPFERGRAQAPVTSLPDVAAATWNSCSDQDAPWECAIIRVPLDYRHPATSNSVSIALTRLPATDHTGRIGSLVLNPGGPGGSGVELAWELAPELPPSMTRRFDIVGFDPRGIGRSTAIDCDGSYSAGAFSGCHHDSDALLPYVGTPNVARDLEMIRRSLGDPQLTYLGFSYGTALGAAYADMFPASVRALVLDGATDPAAGKYNVDGTTLPGSSGRPFYGVQDFNATESEFIELCDASRSCAAGPDARAVLQTVRDKVENDSVRYFTDWGDQVTGSDVDDVISAAMYNVDLWTPLAVALRDAARGDASTMAAMANFLRVGYPAHRDRFDNQAQANLAVFCADFAGRTGAFGVGGCGSAPETAEPLQPVTSAATTTPILVIGTDGDPATPAFQAPKMAAALGNAVSIRWEGAGHTAFLNSPCIDDLVVAYLVDLTVPNNRQRCTFAAGSNTVAGRAEAVFGWAPARTPAAARRTDRLVGVFTAEGSSDARAACLAAGIVDRGPAAIVTYARLGVRRPEYVFLRHRLEETCPA
jgi:pimeloyl-ACP methyl ester carboxylesterase